MWITGAGYADFLRSRRQTNAGYRGMSGFIVESNAEGLSLGRRSQHGATMQ